MNRPRVLLADDHTLVVEGFRKLLEPEFDVVGAVEDGRTLLDVAPRLQPDVILLDIAMPLLNGIDAARQLKKIVPHAKLIFVTMHADAAYVTEAFRAGGSGYLLKRSAATELLVAVREVLQGRFYVTPLVAKELVEPLTTMSRRTKGASAGLTPRQREVLQLIAEGRSNKEMAAILRVSVKAVEFHKSALARRLGIHTTAELTKYAIDHGLVGT
jgi:DNA-binding NarL/FixJ family response regulator